MGFSIPIKFPSDWAGWQSGQGLLVLPPRCEIFLVRTLLVELYSLTLLPAIEHANELFKMVLHGRAWRCK